MMTMKPLVVVVAVVMMMVVGAQPPGGRHRGDRGTLVVRWSKLKKQIPRRRWRSSWTPNAVMFTPLRIDVRMQGTVCLEGMFSSKTSRK